MRIYFYSFLVVLFSCSPSQPSAVTKGKGSGASLASKNGTVPAVSTGTSNPPSTPAPAPAPAAKVDASKLKVSEISVGKLLEGGGSRSEVVNFSMSGSADYVIWQLCPNEEQPNADPTATCTATDQQACGAGGACVQNLTPYNKVLFPHLYAGSVTLSMKACIDPEKSIDGKTCGEFTDFQYNSHYSDQTVAGLFAKRQGILDSLTKLGKEKRQAFVEYQADLQQCLKDDAKNDAYYQSKIQTINELLKGVFWNMWAWGPEKLGQEMMKTSGGKELAAGSKDAFSQCKDEFEKVSNSFCHGNDTTATDATCMSNLKDTTTTMTEAQKEAFCQGNVTLSGAGQFCSILGTFVDGIKGMIEMMNPLNSVAVLSDAIHTVADPEGSVSKLCLAERQLAAKTQAMDENVAGLTDQLISTDDALRAAGEL